MTGISVGTPNQLEIICRMEHRLICRTTGSILILVIGWYILQVVAYWQIFEKAGEPGWKAIIPCYNTYTQYKFTWNANIYWLYYSEP